MKYPITTQKEIRAQFWQSLRDANPNKGRCYGPIRGYTQNDYCTDDRVAFCDFVEMLNRNETISQSLAQRATL